MSMATGYFPAPMVLNLLPVTNCVTQATLVIQLSHVNAQVTSDICGVPRGGLLIFPPKLAGFGAIGWNTWSYNDWRLLKSGNQIRSGPFRTAVAHRIVNKGVYWLLINVKTSKIANLSCDNSETKNKMLLTYVACIYFTVMHTFIEWFSPGQLRNVPWIKNLQSFSQLACNVCLRKIKISARFTCQSNDYTLAHRLSYSNSVMSISANRIK